MPDSCCAVGCTNRRTGENKSLPFYNIPSSKRSLLEQRRRTEWINVIKRDDWKVWSYEKISRARICGAHFISGKRSENPEDPDWVPSIFSYSSTTSLKKSIEKRRRNKRYEHIQSKRKLQYSQASACDPVEFEGTEPESSNNSKMNDTGTQFENFDDPALLEIINLRSDLVKLDVELRERNSELYKLRKENELLRSKLQFGFEKINSSDEWINFFTGLANLSLFMFVVNRVRDKVRQCHSRLSVEDHVLIVFMKLRLGLLSKDIAYRFSIQTSTVSNVYRTWLPVISKFIQNLIIWPDRGSIRRNLPDSFKRKFRDAVCTIDCSEIFIERPSNLTARAQTWSNYKHNNTMKYLIGISPAGAVMFLSSGWGGRVSDKEITIKSGFLDKVSHGDCILADRGFLIGRELNEKGATLKIPSFTKGKKQLSAQEVDESRLLAHIRIHVERVIGRLKVYRLLQTIIPISQVDLLNDAMVTICASINLNQSVVPKITNRKK